MTRSHKIAALATVACVAIGGVALAQIERKPIVDYKDIYYPKAFPPQMNVPEIPFETMNPEFFKLPPATNNWNVDFGEVSGVTDNDQGHIFVLNRGDMRGNVWGGNATELLEFDAQGNYVREIGHNIYGFAYAHAVRVDKDGNPWVVDKGSNMVIKFNYKTGKQTLVLGRRQESSEHFWLHKESEGPPTPRVGVFAEPTDIDWDSQGNIYVADGYINSRIAKFDKNGNWIGTFGKPGTRPGEFRLPHALQIDKNDHIWVGDRTNGRIQIFDTEGRFLREVIINVPTKTYQPIQEHQYPPKYTEDNSNERPQNLAARPGTPYALCYNKKEDVMYVGDIYPGRVYKVDLSGKVLGYFGHVGKEPGNPNIHGLACRNPNIIYTAEFTNNRVQRFVLRPERARYTGN